MTVDVSRKDGVLTVTPDGRLDSSTSGELEEVLNRELNDDVTGLTVDLKQVDFVSSKGLRVLVGAYRTLNGRPMALENANSSIQDVLRMSGLLKIFTVNK